MKKKRFTVEQIVGVLKQAQRSGCNLNRSRTNTKLGTRELGPSIAALH